MSLFGFGFVVAIPPKLVVVAAGWPNVVLWPKSVMFNQCVFVILCGDKNVTVMTYKSASRIQEFVV